MKNFKYFFYRRESRVFSMIINRKCSFFILLFAIFYAVSVQNSFAQNIKTMDEVINAMIVSDKDQSSTDAARLKSLIYDVQSRIYVHDNGTLKTNDNPPVCLTTEPQALELLYETNSLFEQVELITVNILNERDLNFVFDMARLKSFFKLKYVHFLCNYNFDPALIRLKWPESSSRVIVFYQISLPE
ncbi:MAG TPA: hypothetical protein PKL96_03570 [Bacteroidales bacterium]|nr:hypothetical protein [Bacteroidales bacterium]HPS26701.1 hypothetical protein [Bacteroidales bacterium]